MNIDIIPDTSWLGSAPRPPDINPIMEQRLERAHASSTTSSCKENSTMALKYLLNFGLVPDCSDDNTLGHYIAGTLLNNPLNTQYMFQLVLSQSQSIAIPLRSKLLLWFLSNKLRVNIYLFSSRSDSICYKCPRAETSIGLFHRIDSFYNVSEYLVLVSSSHVATIRELPPPAETRFDSDVKVAEFKEGKKRKARRERPEQDELSPEECVEMISKASQKIIHSKIVDIVSPVLKRKKFKANETKKSVLADKFEKTKSDMINVKRVPRNTMDIAHELILDKYHNFTFANFRKSDIEAKLGSETSSCNIFKQYVSSNFDSLWESTLAECEAKMPDQTNKEGDNEDEYQAEDSNGEDKDIRTCTVTLKSILRPDLDHVGELISMLETSQIDVTNFIDELSILVHKTVLMVASGEIYDGSYGQSQQPKPFDISCLLPGFEFRSPEIQSKISVAPIPPLLQCHLEKVLQGDSKSVSDDVALMLTQPHLQFLNTKFLGTQGAQRRAEAHALDVPQDSRIKNPVWERGASLIQPSSPAEYPPTSVKGISKTINEHTRLFSTATHNLWSGSVYQKSLDYLLRILLRIRLAPLREAKFHERRHRIKEKEDNEKKQAEGMEKQAEGNDNNNDQLTDIGRKKWKRMVLGLCDELSVIIQPHNTKINKVTRLEEILKRLKALQMKEPKPRKNSLLSVDERIRLLAHGNNSTKAGGVEDEEISIKGLMGLDGQMLDDLEYLEEIIDPEDDDDPEELYQEHLVGPQGVNHSISQEPTRRHLKALQSVLKVLIESPNIEQEIDSNWVKKTGFEGNQFTMYECEVVADLANRLRPFVPKQWVRSDGKGFRNHSAHVALRAPIVLLANTVLRATGYSEFCRKISPQISPSSLYPLHLGAVGMYEVLCGRSESYFQMFDSSNNLISNKELITTIPGIKSTIFGSILHMTKVNEICRSHGILFSNRITYVDPLTVILTGEVIPHGDNRRGHPVVSEFEKRKKQQVKNGGQDIWAKEFILSGMEKDTMLQKIKVVSEEVKQLESKVKALRKEISEKLSARSMASKKLRAHDPSSYSLLREARQSLRSTRKLLIPYETELRHLKQEIYRLNRMVKASTSKRIDRTQHHVEYTQPTWEHPAAEDKTEMLDLSLLINSRGKERVVAYGGTDYGVHTMSETVAFSESQIIAHVNRYSVLGDNPDIEESRDSESNIFQSIKAPKSFRMSAPQLHHISHCYWTGKIREKRLKSQNEVKDVLKDVSNSGKLLAKASSIHDIDEAQRARRGAREVLRGFEGSWVRTKELRNQRLRSARALVKLCAAERRYVMRHSLNESHKDGVATTSCNSLVTSPPQPLSHFLPPPSLSPVSPTLLASKTTLTRNGWCTDCQKHHIPNHPEAQNFKHLGECPKSDPPVLPILMIGTAGTGVGSRITGHHRRGGSKMRSIHSRSCTVAMTQEHRTSKTCIYCFQQLELALSRRVIKGQEKLVKVNGAVECVNTNCIAFRNKHTIRGRDANAAAAMAISGASLHYNSIRKILPPFSPHIIRGTKNTSQSTGSHHTSNINMTQVVDAMEAPQ